MYEIEQKYRLRKPAAVRRRSAAWFSGTVQSVRRRLKELKAMKVRGGIERNEFYDLGDFFLRRKSALRLRNLKNRRTGVLTLKGPRLRARYTKRLELETAVNLKQAKALLRRTGFRVIARYSKRRDEYKLNTCHVTIDWVPRFGWFLEIEGSAGKIGRIAKQLGLRREDREERSYLEMIR